MLAYYEICPVSINYEFVMFYSIGLSIILLHYFRIWTVSHPIACPGYTKPASEKVNDTRGQCYKTFMSVTH
jgi:hypothetical protein